MHLSETRKGEWSIILSTFLWGLTPVIILFSYGSLSPLVSLAFSTLLASIFFAIFLTLNKKWGDFSQPGIVNPLLVVALSIGIIYYALYFLGLKGTSPGNASLILLMEVFFSYLFFNVWKKEQFDGRHIFGSILMLLGAFLVLFRDFTGFNKSDLLILLATASPPIGNYFQQVLRKKISSEAILFGRSVITFPFIFFLAIIFKENFVVGQIIQSFWYLLITGFLLLGFCKVLWIEGIHRVSVTKAAALEAIGPLFTLSFAFILLHQPPTIWQLLSFIPLAGGLILLTYKKSPSK